MKSAVIYVLVIFAVAATAFLTGSHWVPTIISTLLGLTLVGMARQRPLLDWVYPPEEGPNTRREQ